MSPATGHSATDHPIVVEHLTKRYGDHTVVDDLSFAVEPGRVTGFLGPNGTGSALDNGVEDEWLERGRRSRVRCVADRSGRHSAPGYRSGRLR